MSTVDDILKHHGVKGMRWGVRRSGINIGKIYRKPAATPPTSSDFQRAQAARSKVTKGKSPTKHLENDELQALVKRMNLEKQYAELSSRDKRKVVGAKFVGDVIGGVAKGQATRLGNQIAAEQIDKLLKQKK